MFDLISILSIFQISFSERHFKKSSQPVKKIALVSNVKKIEQNEILFFYQKFQAIVQYV